MTTKTAKLRNSATKDKDPRAVKVLARIVQLFETWTNAVEAEKKVRAESKAATKEAEDLLGKACELAPEGPADQDKDAFGKRKLALIEERYVELSDAREEATERNKNASDKVKRAASRLESALEKSDQLDWLDDDQGDETDGTPVAVDGGDAAS